ncbi:type ISP restriction/modification enzyme [Candidatus Spongiihabitans sp.]|uniref:type ISP restriction/modification enzyme n=1 Tax=Candidatus Spongiihabitans sp. TaxID=3101308 RepID=UPI003C7E7040
MSIQFINAYHAELENLRKVSGSRNESELRDAFQTCLKKYCANRDLTLIAEHPDADNRKARPDGTIKDKMRLPWGYWEAKDDKDDLDKEIDKKIHQRGYRTSNILFENTVEAVLIQDNEEVRRVNMEDAKELDALILKFLHHAPPEVANFHKATAQFKEDMPQVLIALREMITKSYQTKSDFRTAADDFLQLCRETINPEVEAADVREMLIQHILTKDIFLKVFNEDQFHKENNIASRLDHLEETFFTGDTKRAMVDRLKGYYSAITATAASIESHQEKQKFLKAIYEDFYKVYNPKAADRLGVVYTPNEIVDFMIKATDELVHKHFGRRIYDKNVQILDPAAGTGTFITDLIEFIPTANLPYKYQHEIHANEVSILPYYIANLNIEYTYKQKTGTYKEFPNICFVDTLDNLGFVGRKGKGQADLIGSLSHENLQRVKKQNEKRISVIIGNPPYNANQRNENDNNKNREYPGIDARIKETYIARSTAQKTKQYDMYKRFIRWASDRLDNDGVLAFITNRSWLDSKQDDGFRKIVCEEFNEIYAVDLGGDIRKMPGVQNVFGIMTGVAIGFFVRRKEADGCEIHYYQCGDYDSAEDKLAFLSITAFSDINFEHIVPDQKQNWLEQTDNDFDGLLCLANKKTKLAKTENPKDTSAVFKLFSLGVVTNRDDWTYDFDKSNLRKKVRYFCKFYDDEILRFHKENPHKGKIGDWVNREIKWTTELEAHLLKGNEINYSNDSIIDSLYRPFVKQKLYYQNRIVHRLYQMPNIFPTGKKGENRVICFNVNGKDYYVLGGNKVPNLHFTGDTQCLPLYRYDEKGDRRSNITQWGIQKFQNHYATKKITAEDVFHYTYAVLHNPAYREKYAVNLKREFPRLPFYDDFAKWVKWGKELMTLHIDFEKQPPYPLKRIDKPCEAGDAKLKADKQKGIITLDQKTQLTDIPCEAWNYQLGGRSALEWVLDQYKEKKPKDPTIREKFNTYRFADHKEHVIDLLGRVCTVSVKTMKIINQMREG